MVVEQHRDVAGPVRVDGRQTLEQEVGRAHRLIAEVAVAPGAVALAQGDAFGDVRVGGPRFELGPEGEGCVEFGGGGHGWRDQNSMISRM